MGLAGRIQRHPIIENVELRRLGGRHPHALEEMLTRRDRSERLRAALARDDRGRFVARGRRATAEAVTRTA